MSLSSVFDTFFPETKRRSRFFPVPAPKKPDGRQFKVGDRVTVSLSGGRIVDATVTAVVKRTEGIRLQVSYGKDETALAYLCQVRAHGD
jgi:hypothetical protein